MAKDEIVDAEAEQKSDNTFLTGIVVFTTIALFVGFILIEMAWKHNYGRGLLA